jgi:hypothetical protein
MLLLLLLLLVLLLQLRPDGTVQAAAGGSVASSNAISNPLLNILTQGAYKNRPEASSTAYTQIPLLMGKHSHLKCLSYKPSRLEPLGGLNPGFWNVRFDVLDYA